MKLLHVTSMTYPSTRANRIQTLAMARAFTRALPGAYTLLLSAGDVDVPHVLVQGKSPVLAWRAVSCARAGRYSHVYCREERLLFFMMIWSMLRRIPFVCIYEAHHAGYVRGLYRLMVRHVSYVVTLTQAMRDDMVAFGVAPDHVLVAPDGVDLMQFGSTLSIAEARQRLALPEDRRIVLYAGSIDKSWKGVDVLYGAAQKLDSEYLILILGGKPQHVEAFNATHPSRSNVRLIGHKPHEEVPLYMQAADILVIPNSAHARISRFSTSPLKLFEYMAVGRPIVASDLPSLREVADDSMVQFVRPDNSSELAAGIRKLAENREQAAALARAAQDAVQHYTWDERARRIIGGSTVC